MTPVYDRVVLFHYIHLLLSPLHLFKVNVSGEAQLNIFRHTEKNTWHVSAWGRCVGSSLLGIVMISLGPESAFPNLQESPSFLSSLRHSSF